MSADTLEEQQFAGRRLYGDDFVGEQISRWTEQTDAFHRAYFEAHRGQVTYQYRALDHFHALARLERRRYGTCLALGCAAGDDVAALAGHVDRFIAVEPIEQYWRDEIGGTPVQYLRPTATGDLPLESGSVDLLIAFDVLHHIPNVTHLLGEFVRVLRPGGMAVVRDPISSMGDWRRPRRGLTVYERGLPLAWFEQAARAQGLLLLRRRLCIFVPLSRALRRLRIARPLTHKPIIVLDWIISQLFSWNIRYRRAGLKSKFAPSSALWVLEKPRS